MAEAVRTSVLIAALGVASACGDDSTPAPPRTGPSVREVAPIGSDLAGPDVLDAILEHGHGKRRGEFDRSILELRSTPDGEPDVIRLRLPSDIRVTRPNGTQQALVGSEAYGWHRSDEVQPLSTTDADGLAALRDTLAAMLLTPATDSAETERTSETVITWTTAAGARWMLTFDPASRRPVRVGLEGAATLCEFIDFYESPVTCIPTRVRLHGIGERHVTMLETKVDFDDDAFGPPTAGGTLVTANGKTVEQTRLGEPEITQIPERQLLSIADPGTWQGRWDILHTIGTELYRRGWESDGDPFLTQDGETRWLGFPIVESPDRETQPLDLKKGQRLQQAAAHRVAAIEATRGPFAPSVARAHERLDRYLDEHGLEATGPVRVIFNVPTNFDPKAQDEDPSKPTHLVLRLQLPTGK